MRLAARAARDSGVLSSVDDDSLENAYLPLAERLASSAAGHGPSPLTFGIVGGPGAGKSTLSEYLGVMLEAGYDLKVARFGLDDVYLSKEARRELGQRVHPLFATRGVPGTHNVEMVPSLLERLRGATEETHSPLPRFDKSADDLLPRSAWPIFLGKPDVILFDTWLWDVRPPTDEELLTPINRREAEEDPDGRWRMHATSAFKERYLPLFQEADEWIQFELPSWESMVRFREEQEFNRLVRRGEDAADVMRRRERSIADVLELFERWLRLPHNSEPNHRIVVDREHSAHLVS